MYQNNKTAGKTAKIFEVGVDYTIKTLERPYKYILEDKTVIYLTREQYRFMTEEYWKAKKEHSYLSRCIIDSNREGFKRCTKDCKNCKWYKTPFANSGIMRLDAAEGFELEECKKENDYDFFKDSTIHDLLKQYIHELDSTDKAIMLFKLEGLNETEIAKRLNISQRAIAKRRIIIFEVLKAKLMHLKP